MSGRRAEIVQSLAKWKRLALHKYGFAEGQGIYTAEQLVRVGFNSGSVLQRALTSLVEKEVLSKNDKYQFQDAMFKKWVQNLS